MSKCLPGETGRQAGSGEGSERTHFLPAPDLGNCRKITHLARGYLAVTCLTQELVIHPKASQKCVSQQALPGSDLGESRDLSRLCWGEGVEGRVRILLLFN